MKFKVGDKVRILRKNTGVNIGDIAYIRRVISIDAYYCYYLKINNKDDTSYAFIEEDLELVKEEKVKYKPGKNLLYVKNLWEQSRILASGRRGAQNPTDAENASFITKMIKEFGYNYGDMIIISEKFIDYFTQHPCFVQFLLANEFIEKVKEFKPFTIELKIDSPEEYWGLWHRLNFGSNSLENYLKGHNHNFSMDGTLRLFGEIDKYKGEVDEKENN